MKYKPSFEVFKNPLIASVIMMLAFMLCTLLLFQVKYHMPDDVGMVMRVAGISKTVAPSEFIMNSNILVGKLLAGLYGAWPGVDWYPYFLIFMIFLSGMAINFAVLRLRLGLLTLALCTAFMSLVMSFYIVDLSYTTTASILGVSGAALAVSLLFKPPEAKAISSVPVISSILLFLMSALLREKSFFLIGVLTFITVVLMLGFKRDNRRIVLCGVIGISALGIGSVFVAFDRHTYTSDTAMNEFLIQKKIKSRFIEYGQITYSEENRHVFEACNVSENDFMMMRYWFYDTSVENFSVEKIQCIADGFPKRKQYVGVKELVKTTSSIYKQHAPILLFVLLVGALGSRSPPKIALGICAFVIPGLVFSYMNIFFKPAPLRVATPVFGFFACMVFIAHAVSTPKQDKEHGSINLAISSVVLAVIFGTVGLQINKHFKSGRAIEIRQNKLQDYTAQLNPQDDDIYLVWVGGSYPTHWASPFGDIRKQFSHYHQVGVGTSFNSPLSRAQLTRFGIDNPYLDIVDNQHANFIFTQRNVGRFFPIYKEFLRINYGLDVCFVVDKTIDKIVVGSVKTQDQCKTLHK